MKGLQIVLDESPNETKNVVNRWMRSGAVL
jgi:hypothetical protein